MEKQRNNFFWPSYVDLLTALFAVVLVLFILSFKLFKDKESELRDEVAKNAVEAEEYKRIKRINDQIKALENTGVFVYDTIYKRFLVKEFIGEEIFVSNDDNIKPEYYQAAINAGQIVKSLVDSLYNSQRIRFLVLIEGNAAKYLDGRKNDPNNQFAYELSYRRALALKLFWINQGIIFDQNNSEILVSGSGYSGIGRDKTKEEYNKRFIIQIIPKIDK